MDRDYRQVSSIFSIIAFIIAFFPTLAWSEPSEKTGALHLQDVVLTGTLHPTSAWTSPIATQSITIEAEHKATAGDVSEVLRRQAGLNLVPGIRGSTLRLQGLDGKYVLVLIDGQRLTGRVGDAIDLSSIPVEDIERIEIIRGNASVLYGSDAIGGVINIIRRPSRSNSLQISGQLSSQDHRSLASRWQMARRNWQQSISVQADEAATQFRGNSTASTLSGISQKAVTLQRKDQLTPALHLGLDLSWQDGTVSGRDLSGAGAISDRSNHIVRQQLSLSPSYRGLEGQELILRSQLQSYRDTYKTQISSRSFPATREESHELLQQHTLSYSQFVGLDHLLTGGAEFLDETLRSDRLLNATAARQRHSLFLQDEWNLKVDGSWQIVPGLRWDQDSQFGGHSSSKIALRHLWAENTVLRTSYGQGYRAPSFKELYLRFENQSAGYIVSGAEDLKPEESEDYQFSIVQQFAAGSEVSLSLFLHKLKNMIEATADEAGGQGVRQFRYRNMRAAETKGFDLAYLQKLQQGSVRWNWQYLQAQDLSRKIALEGRSKHHLSCAWQGLGWSRNWRWSHNGHWWSPQTYYEVDGRPQQSPPLFTADVGLIWSGSETWELSGHINNLNNSWDDRFRKVRERSYVAGFNWKHQQSSGDPE